MKTAGAAELGGALTDRTWGGSRWWKWDLHTHTPASEDYGKGPDQAELKDRSPQEWLLDQMRAGIDCVAITDHNSGAWVDQLKVALEQLEADRPEGFRPLHLFPGVELSVNGGVHLLAILSPDCSTSDIDSLLGAVGFPPGQKGSSDAVTEKSLPEVVELVDRAGGIAIPAHVDAPNGLFALSGTTLAQVVDSRQIFAMELIDLEFTKPEVYAQKKRNWTEVLGSDSHHPTGEEGQRYPGSHFTWIKMGPPTLEGLRLALLDGRLSVRRAGTGADDPNEHAPLMLESIEVVDAHYMGQAKPFVVVLNPWLNTIIGGRGTGKSTLVEFARLALRRENDLPDALREDFSKYGSVYPDEGPGALLRAETAIRIVYRKDGSRYRIQWSPSGELDAIQEDVEGEWQPAEGDVRQRFPVRLFSQKQVFHLANRPRALLGVVDEAEGVDRQSWNDRMEKLRTQFLTLRARAREIETQLADESRLRGELDDVKRKLAVFEEAGHSDVLQTYQRRSRQKRTVDLWDESWAETGDQLRQVAQDIVPPPLDRAEFEVDSDTDLELIEAADEARKALSEIRDQQEALANQADEVLEKWRKAREDSSWTSAVGDAEAAYDDLKNKLLEEGAGDPSAYADLVQRRHAIEERLGELEGLKDQVADLKKQADDRLSALAAIRQELTSARADFLSSVLGDNRFVRITVLPYRATDTVEVEFRERIQKEDGAFEKDIGSGAAPEAGGLLGEVYEDPDAAPAAIEGRLAQLKARVREIAEGQYEPSDLGDQRFATHLGKLAPEALDRLDLWFPEDSLRVEYSPTGDGKDFRPIEEGSPGQKTAALLAFLLSYGDEPLVLDQPEDDLDNQLIYDLIVNQLRQVKGERQILVVTHNPNIVVNGDAELVLALTARGGETQKEAEGSLQGKHVRDTICRIMEGGPAAFRQRYQRIALEGHGV